MKHFAKFRRYWQDLGTNIHKLVNTKAGAKLLHPEVENPTDLGAGRFRISFSHPAFFYNAPQKSSSNKLGQSHRQAIVVDGEFHVEDTDDGSVLVWASCSMCIYATEDLPDSYTMRLTDAMHFDVEKEPACAFHPQFHVQRGRSHTITTDSIKACVQRARRIDADKIVIHDDTDLGSPYVRLPTPPMDYVNVLATIVADFFCRSGVGEKASNSTVDSFRDLLRLILGSRNLMHDGTPSRVLRQRWNENASKFATGRWYAESTL